MPLSSSQISAYTLHSFDRSLHMPVARAESPAELQAATVPQTDCAAPSPFSFAYVRQLLAIAWFFLTAALVVAPLTLVLSLVPRIKPSVGQTIIHRLFAFWLAVTGRLNLIEVEFHGADRLAGLEGTIVAPNHPSLLDAVLLLSKLPRATCIMRARLIGGFVLRAPARLAGYIPNDHGPALVRQGIRKVRQGENLLVFPEGTRTRNQAVNAFQKGFALIAVETGAPIQTVLIERFGAYLSKHVPLFTPTPLPIRFRVTVGEVLRAEPGESPKELAMRLENHFRTRLRRDGADIRLAGGDD
jgi:1-acyl-sn-glycerol-3-phosphate acyltransferase